MGTHVRVQDVYVLPEIHGKTPDEIEALPLLTFARGHAAVPYYFDRREEILRETKEAYEFARKLQAVAEAK